MNALESYDKTHQEPAQEPICECGYLLHQHSKAGQNCPDKDVFEGIKNLVNKELLEIVSPLFYSIIFDNAKNFTERK